jgi:hypothetical protein
MLLENSRLGNFLDTVEKGLNFVKLDGLIMDDFKTVPVRLSGVVVMLPVFLLLWL